MDDRVELLTAPELEAVNGGVICGACTVIALIGAISGESGSDGATVGEAGGGVSGSAG